VGFLDDARKKLGKAVDKHGDKIGEGLDKAGSALDKKTGGKHSAKIRTGVDKAKTALDGIDGKQDDLPSASTPTPPAAPNESDSDPTGPTAGAGA